MFAVRFVDNVAHWLYFLHGIVHLTNIKTGDTVVITVPSARKIHGFNDLF